LAERIAKDKACLTNLMNNLEKKGYVHRKEDPADRRNKQVYLTPEGEEFKEQIRPILDQVYVYAEQVIGIESIELTCRSGSDDVRAVRVRSCAMASLSASA